MCLSFRNYPACSRHEVLSAEPVIAKQTCEVLCCGICVIPWLERNTRTVLLNSPSSPHSAQTLNHLADSLTGSSNEIQVSLVFTWVNSVK